MNTAERTTPSLSSLTSKAPAGTAPVPRPVARWRTRVLVPLAILVAVLALLGYAARDVLTPAVGVQVVPVIAKQVGGDPTEVAPGEPPRASGPLVQAPGWIEPDPYAVNVPALIDGVIKEVLVLEGQSVEAGQVVATIIDDELRIAERTAKAAVAEREAEVGRAEAALATARARVQVEEAAREALRDEIARKRPLVQVGGLSEGDFRRMEIRLRGVEAGVTEANSSAQEAEAGVRQVQATLETARAMLADAELRIERSQVRSPFAGVVLARLVEPGSRIAMGGRGGESGGMIGAVARLYDPAKLQARVDVPLGDAAKIGVGTPAEVTTEALPGRTFTGAVTRLMHEANIQRNTVQFKVAIESPAAELKPEMLCRVRFNPTGSAASASDPTNANPGLRLVLPAAAVINRSETRGQVWLVQHSPTAGASTAVLKDVELGTEEGEALTVVSGVSPGDRAIVGPPPRLRPGKRVRILGEIPTPN